MAKITEGDIGRLRQSIHKLLGDDENQIDLSKIPISDLLNVGKVKDAENIPLADIESKLLQSGITPAPGKIEMLARQAQASKKMLEDYFTNPQGTPPVPLVNLPIKEQGVIDSISQFFGGNPKSEIDVNNPEYLQNTLPSLIEQRIGVKKKTFEDLTPTEHEMIQNYFTSLGKGVDNEEDYRMKLGDDLGLFDRYMEYYNKQEETPKDKKLTDVMNKTPEQSSVKSTEIQQALDWAKSNPDDPRSAEILKRIQGGM